MSMGSCRRYTKERESVLRVWDLTFSMIMIRNYGKRGVLTSNLCFSLLDKV
jgi:hypothetical protein